MNVPRTLVLLILAVVVSAGCSKKPAGPVPNVIEEAVKAGDRGELDDLIADVAERAADRKRDVAAAKQYVAQEVLKFVAIHNKMDLFGYALENGADPKAGDSDGVTPLHLAAQHGSMDVARALLQKGANVNARMLMGDTPLDYAAGAQKTDMVNLLKAEGGRSGH